MNRKWYAKDDKGYSDSQIEKETFNGMSKKEKDKQQRTKHNIENWRLCITNPTKQGWVHGCLQRVRTNDDK